MTDERLTLYFVTVFYLPKEHRDSKEPFLYRGQKYEDYVRKRCWGWFRNYSDAEKCIRENWTDIYENGYYDLAVIEPYEEGICNLKLNAQTWFDVEYVDGNHYKVEKVAEPKRFKGWVGWSYG